MNLGKLLVLIKPLKKRWAALRNSELQHHFRHPGTGQTDL